MHSLVCDMTDCCNQSLSVVASSLHNRKYCLSTYLDIIQVLNVCSIIFKLIFQWLNEWLSIFPMKSLLVRTSVENFNAFYANRLFLRFK